MVAVETAQERRTSVARKVIDCRHFPGPCTLTIAGEEDEVVPAQAAHLAAVHGMADTPQVRAHVRSVLKDETPVAMRQSEMR
jgi:hypothetical protein